MLLNKKIHSSSENAVPSTTEDSLRHLAFDHAALANIISTVVNNGKIIMANRAACKLLGYTKRELMTKSRADIFNIKEDSFKTMLKQRTAGGQSFALVTAIKKSRKQVPCEISSAVFMDEDGIEKAITTIADMRQNILKQKKKDLQKEQIVAVNIASVQSKQKEIDRKKEKIVAGNIELVKSAQRGVDAKNEKAVADNIALAKSKQKEIDRKKEKIVAGNIELAKSAQRGIDAKNERAVADNIALVKSKQKRIDLQKEQIVADNIASVQSKQKKIDRKKEKIVAGNIQLAQAKSDARQVKNNEWLKYVGKNLYDVMWDWDIATGRIYVGDSIEEVFGYKVKNNTIHFTAFTRRLLPEGKDAVKDKLEKAIASSDKSWNDNYKLIRKDGSVAVTSSRASIIRDGEGKAIHLIGATRDISKLFELKRKLAEKNLILKEEEEKFLLASKLSFDVIWDRNLLTNEISRGEGFEELLGYPSKEYKGNVSDWSDHIHPDDKKEVENGLLKAITSSVLHWEQAFRIVKADGSVARVFDRASIIRNADGKAIRMIGAMHDLSRQKELEEKLEQEMTARGHMHSEYQKNFQLIFNSSAEILYDVDLIKDEVILSDAYEAEFGYKKISNSKPISRWFSHIHPDDKEAFMNDYNRMIKSDDLEWKYSFRFLRADGSVANLITKSIVLRNTAGKAYRRIGYLQDISKQKVLEERLEKEIKLKELQIADAMEEAKETERSDIGKELHDNVNQLLGASRLYLEMAKQGGADSELYVSRSSEYTLTAIEEIRKLSKGLITDTLKFIGLSNAIENIAMDTMEINPVKISCSFQRFTEHLWNDKLKLNVYRIVQEQLSNILKHAKASQVDISLSQKKKQLILVIKDNGCGFDTTKKRKGIGVANIKNRAANYNGIASFVSSPGHGCILTVTFPVTAAK